MDTKNIENIYPLSPMQAGMLFHSLVAPETGVYFEQTSWVLRGELDLNAFERAWQRVLERHTALRTAFMWEDLDDPLQITYRQLALPLDVQDWRGLPAAEQQTRLAAYLQADRARGFELETAPLMRLALLRLADDVVHFVWSHHHLLLDGWSQPIIFQEVFGLYAALCAGQEPPLPPARPFSDYVAWLQAQDMDAAATYWRQTLAGFTAPTPLVVDQLPQPDPAPDAEPYALKQAALPAELTQQLQSFAQQQGLTLNTLIQGAYALLLHRYSGEDDVLFGATVSGRPPELPGVEGMVGLFINTLPVRVRINPQQTVAEWLQGLQAQQTAARNYEFSPLVDIQGWSEVRRDVPLFESILVFESYPVEDIMDGEGGGNGRFQIEPAASFTKTNYPLTVAVSPGRELGIEVAYDTTRFRADTIDRLVGHLGTLLAGIVADPHAVVAAVPLLAAAERRQILVDWTATNKALPYDKLIHERFEEWVTQTPEATALIFDDGQGHTQQLTYAELDARANQLAQYLQKQGLQPETLVGICFGRSIDAIVALFGVLKAGGAFVPIDPEYPPERIGFILEDTQLPLLLTHAHILPRLPEHAAQVICLDRDWPAIAQESTDKPRNDNTPTSLAYVIYTSGSTGAPKGALLHHRGFNNFAFNFGRDFHFKPGSRTLQFSSFSFDASVAEIGITLTTGATLVLTTRETIIATSDLADLLRAQQVTHIVMPPTLLRLLPNDNLPDLQHVVSVGEACTPDLARRWMNGRHFYNGYGPTETSIGCIWSERITHLPQNATSVPIGRPAHNVYVYLLDLQGRPVPIGVPGEICVGGVNVGIGYLNRPELNAAKFVADPFRDDPQARMYKTGDLGRWLPDGSIEFVGRIDHQVKLRGFRIELGEIEARLKEHASVEATAVVVRSDEAGEKHMVAFVVPAEADTPFDVGALRDSLKAQLPDYMVPAYFVALDALPLLPSGKVNRRALPELDEVSIVRLDSYVAPRSPEEEIVAGIWAQVLNVERVGVHDNFFELGGHSLLATQLVSRVRAAFDLDLPLRKLFDDPTVAGLARQVQVARDSAAVLAPPITRAARPDDPAEGLPVSFAQQRLWLLDQLEPGALFYNIPTAIRIRGALDVDLLARALNAIVQRHESLRTTFKAVDGRPVQIITPDLDLPLEVVDLQHLPVAEREAAAVRLARAEARRPFDLAQGPLIRAQLLRLAPEEHVALLTLHHIVSDGWSMGVLVREIAAFYAAGAAGAAPPLPELSVQYPDYAVWQRQWLQGDVLAAQLDYWKAKLAGSPPLLDLPTDRPRPAVQSSNGATINFALPPDLSADLKALSQEMGVTLFMTLMAAFQTLLYRYSGQTDISVGTPIANRTREEIEGLIGFFVNTLVMRTDLSAADGGAAEGATPSFEELLERVRETALEAYAHQDVPFEMLVEKLQPERDLSHTPLFQVMFVLNNTPAGDLELGDLTLRALEIESGTATFDMTLSMVEGPESIGGMLEYNTDLFDRATMERLIAHFENLLAGAVADPEQPIGELPMLTEGELRHLLVEWNQTAVPYPDNATIHALFEAQAAQRPDAPAIIKGDVQLSYAELDRKANQLAHYLRRQGVQPGSFVGLMTGRSPEMVVGILGALKAGAAYIPIDPAYPPERQAFMIEDAQPAVILTTLDELAIDAPQAPIINLLADWPTIAQQPAHNPKSEIRNLKSDDLAYVIYTSGSTGLPKGTMLRHRGLCNLATWHRKAFGLRPGESRILQFSPLSFDASVWETVMALRNGAALVLADQETLASGDALAALLRAQRVTTVTLPPSMLAVMPDADLPDLETIVAAGEACPAELVQRWGRGRQFVNAYGPTETTVCASMYECDPAEEGNPPIGRPIDNFQLYVLDANLQPAPVGVPGELCVGGVGLAQGYLNRPEMTAQKFIPIADCGLRIAEYPELHAQQSTFVYRTGDLVRYRPDGNLEFLGRIDHQVKVRGFRIELGEIEAVLEQHPDVQSTAVLAREDTPGNKELVGYAVPQPGKTLEIGALRRFLREKLPEYMVPTQFVLLEQMPLTPSNKIDRKALPAPERSREALAQAYVAPRNAAEETLAALCADLLHLERVGVHDNFFELGGHSLLATQFISRVRDAFQVEIPLRTLFAGPTVADVAAAVAQAQMQAASAQAQAPAITRRSRADRTIKRADLTRTGVDGAGRTEPERHNTRNPQ